MQAACGYNIRGKRSGDAPGRTGRNGVYQLEPSIADKLISSLNNRLPTGAVQSNQTMDAEAIAGQTDLTDK